MVLASILFDAFSFISFSVGRINILLPFLIELFSIVL